MQNVDTLHEHRPCITILKPPRSLDADLGSIMKAADPDFDWKRISFVLEAWLWGRTIQ